MQDLCRICAQLCDTLVPIFQKEGPRSNIDIKIKKCLSINITETDSKPKYVCYNCFTKLDDYNEFFDMCHASNYKFETILYAAEMSDLQAQQQQQPADDESVVLMRSPWDVDKNDETDATDGALNQSVAQPSNGVIVVSKVDERHGLNQDCRDILLMVELKYKDESGPTDEANSDAKRQPSTTTVLRHSDDYDKAKKCPQTLDPIVSNKNDSSSRQQQNNASSKKVKPFPCTYCSKSFMRRSSLQAHVSNHTNNKPFGCNLCDKTFALRWDLTVHQRLHTGMFMCEYCKKVFASKGKLERHRRVHTGEKPFNCCVKGCDKSFADKRNLESHKDTHTDVRPFGCGRCDKRFKNKAHLADHQKVHSSESLFTCETCGKSFKWKANLKIHVKNGSCMKVKTNNKVSGVG